MNDSRWDRLASAILLQAVRDWRVNVRELNNSKHYDIAMRELKGIIDFITSDWFLYLTSGTAPQIDYCKRLIKDVKAKQDQIELTSYMKKRYHYYKEKSTYGHERNLSKS